MLKHKTKTWINRLLIFWILAKLKWFSTLFFSFLPKYKNKTSTPCDNKVWFKFIGRHQQHEMPSLFLPNFIFKTRQNSFLMLIKQYITNLSSIVVGKLHQSPTRSTKTSETFPLVSINYTMPPDSDRAETDFFFFFNIFFPWFSLSSKNTLDEIFFFFFWNCHSL